MPQVVVGTAGHIDHGKTSLVKALTGVNTDRLIEEKERGMTIDLGFAYLNETTTIIDVPGHEKFIRNMAAGAANIHFGLIVVAADDGVMPQTIEHLEILTLLGVNKGWVAITKIDVVKDCEWIDLVELDIRECLISRGFQQLSVNRINNLNGDGVEQLRSDIANVVNDIEPEFGSKYFRMNIDRVFSKTGFGTVATGTVVNGVANKGDEVEILPSMSKAKIRGLQSHGGSLEKVITGDRAAINFSNIKANELDRGYTICASGMIEPTQQAIVSIKMIKSTSWQIKNKQRLRFHFGTSEVLGRVAIHGQKILKKDHSLSLVLNLESPVAMALDDRFVVRSYSPMETIAGGIVLETTPSIPWSKMKGLVFEMPIETDKRFRFLVEFNWRNPKSLESWQKKFFSSNYKIQVMQDDGLELSDNGILFSKYGKERSIDEIIKYFEKCYDNNPFRRVITAESIINTLHLSDEWFDIMADQMIQDNMLEDCQGGYALSDYKVQFSDKDKNDIGIIEKILVDNGQEPTQLVQIIELTGFHPKRVGDLLHILLGQEKAQALGNHLYLHDDQLKFIKSSVIEYFNRKKTLAVGDFKELTGLTRKTAIPLLEYLDNSKYTYREGNVRFAGKNLNE